MELFRTERPLSTFASGPMSGKGPGMSSSSPAGISPAETNGFVCKAQERAIAYLRAGFSVIPVRENKAPDLPEGFAETVFKVRPFFGDSGGVVQAENKTRSPRCRDCVRPSVRRPGRPRF